MQPKILVIESRDHNRATCIDYLFYNQGKSTENVID